MAGGAPGAPDAGAPGDPPSTAAVDALKQEALDVAARLQRDYPSDVDPVALMGAVHNLLGDSVEAVKCWEECLKRDPRRADALSSMAMIAFEKEEYERAEALWRSALKIAPRAPGLHNGLARALLSQGKAAEAVVALEQEIAIVPRSAFSHFLLGQAHLQLKQYEKAKRHYQTAVSIRPEDWNAYYGLATASARLGLEEEARKYRQMFAKRKAADLKVTIDRTTAFDDLASMRDGVARVRTAAGRFCLVKGKAAQAEQHWRRAAELDPTNTVCRAQLAALLQSRTDTQAEARRLFAELQTIEPAEPMHWLNAALIDARAGRFDDAERMFRRVRQLAPKRSLGSAGLAQLYLRANRKLAEAKALAEEAVKLEPAAINYVILAEACDKNGDLPGATAAMKRALELEPNNLRYRQIAERLKRRGK